MSKETIIKIRVSKYLKQRAKDCASFYGWSLSQYIRHLILVDIDDPLYDHIIPLVSGNVDTLNEIKEFRYQGRRFAIVPENLVKNITEINGILIENLEANLKVLLEKGIRKRPILKKGLNYVFLYAKDDLCFIIEENDFDLKHAISELSCIIIENFFDSIVFDITILILDEIDLEKLKAESYSQLFP